MVAHSINTVVASEDMELAGLWEAYGVSRAEELRNRLLVHYLPLARMIARYLASRLPSGAAADVDDLTQAATLGLRDAIASFDASRGIKFEHYCGPRVRGAALDFLRTLDWAPRLLRSRLNRLQEVTSQFEMSSGIAPTDEELSGAMNLTPEEFAVTRREAANSLQVRMTVSDNEDLGKGVDLANVEDAKLVDPAVQAQRADLREFLVQGLTKTERQVTMLYYFDNFSLREIGETLDLCESRVSQIHQSVLARLRERIPRIGGYSADD